MEFTSTVKRQELKPFNENSTSLTVKRFQGVSDITVSTARHEQSWISSNLWICGLESHSLWHSYVSYYTHYKVILVFVILQIFSTRWKNVNEQHIVCYLGCLLFSILWYVFRNVTEHSETLSELVTRSEIDFKFSVNSDLMILFQCFCFFRGKLSLEYFSFDSFDVSAFEFDST